MSVRFTRTLVPLDIGTASDAALVCAKELAAKFGSRLFLLHIVEDPIATGAWTPDVYIAASAELPDTLLHHAKQRLESTLTAEERERINAFVEARVGSAAKSIGEFALEKSIDLIVMGTHGRRDLGSGAPRQRGGASPPDGAMPGAHHPRRSQDADGVRSRADGRGVKGVQP
jgi:nucleotide-binding universal stress UspA family protein